MLLLSLLVVCLLFRCPKAVAGLQIRTFVKEKLLTRVHVQIVYLAIEKMFVCMGLYAHLTEIAVHCENVFCCGMVANIDFESDIPYKLQAFWGPMRNFLF